ncbi:hypothetical protein M433DRAFT_495441 [Acidomyces richmondensis BFW]|nr:MAG: hypothetical protein FE78DRAFT_298746 [Acidomyces sp. 'richmondensis']KYG47450.1 hypothetical protein M433DRAFT_495441 [Acidomyces richmondensis BFW]
MPRSCTYSLSTRWREGKDGKPRQQTQLRNIVLLTVSPSTFSCGCHARSAQSRSSDDSRTSSAPSLGEILCGSYLMRLVGFGWTVWFGGQSGWREDSLSTIPAVMDGWGEWSGHVGSTASCGVLSLKTSSVADHVGVAPSMTMCDVLLSCQLKRLHLAISPPLCPLPAKIVFCARFRRLQGFYVALQGFSFDFVQQ